MKRTKHIYKRFFSLHYGQSFFIRCGKLAVKTGPLSYREHAPAWRADDGIERWGKQEPEKKIAPWRKVRILVPTTTTLWFWFISRFFRR